MECTYLKTNISNKSESKAHSSMYSLLNLKFGNNASIVIIHFMIHSGVTEEDNETVRIHYERQDKSKRHVATCPSILPMECHSTGLKGVSLSVLIAF